MISTFANRRARISFNIMKRHNLKVGRRHWITLMLGSVLVFAAGSLKAQTLQDQYAEYYERASNWEDYKVIKAYQVKEFWGIVTDSLDMYRDNIHQANVRITGLDEKIKALETDIAGLKSSLEASNEINDSITFFGIDFKKAAYHTFVWVIIAGLAAAVVFIYLVFLRTRMLNKKLTRDNQYVNREFMDYKERANQKQVHLKRDLQTVINALEENNIKVSSLVGFRNSGSN